MSEKKKTKSIKDPLNKYPLIAQKLRAVRIQNSITQDNLGKMFGLSGQAVSAYENGNVLPSIESLMKYHEYFGIDLNYLLGDDEAEDEASHFSISQTEMQIIMGYRRRSEPIRKAIRTICYNGTSFHTLDEEIKESEDNTAHLKEVNKK